MSDTSKGSENLTALKRALLALDKLQRKLDSLEAQMHEPIAIIGAGCRTPGNASDLESFWKLLREGVDAIVEYPTTRGGLDAFYDANQDAPGKLYVREGGFLEAVDQFDAEFFGISPLEAASMDPQQRLLLETTWEALEHGGQCHEKLMGSRTGIFMGVCFDEYSQLHLYSGDPSRIDSFSFTGTASSVMSGRLSYFLGAQGPSIALDTACSSSLVAVHLACQSLRARECDMALAGGVNLILSAENTISFCRAHALSPSGRCKTFDDSADGFARGEGCGVVVLKRLSSALEDGDHILALIRGSAINQDGRSNGLTAPNGPSQVRVIRDALSNAGVKACQVSYVEAHGTGTSLGDPIEARALGEVYREGRPADHPLYIGSVKTNIGHLEAAAGVIGLIKVVLSLEHKQIPPHLHFKQLNPLIKLDDIPARIPTELTPWPGEDGQRFGAVSAFGISGTNAHVVLQEASSVKRETPLGRPPYLLVLSAHTSEALNARAQAIQSFLEKEPAATMEDFCWTAAARRTHYGHRLAVAGATYHDLAELLGTFLDGETHPSIASAHCSQDQQPKLAFVFSGQGPQWWGMGRELLDQERVFKEKIEECDAFIQSHASWSLMAELCREEKACRLDQTEIAQPALFALQVALAAVWRSWNVLPDAVIGHSVGEVAAAHISGALSLEDAVRVVFHRGRLMQQATGTGKMAEVELPAPEADQLVASYGGQLSVAALNSPNATVLSGETAAIEAVMNQLKDRGVGCHLLPVNYPFHSRQMIPFESALASQLEGLSPQRNLRPMVSTVTGSLISGEDLTAEYWGRNIRQPVRFADAIESLVQQDFRIFLEISPHPVLGRQMEATLHHQGLTGVLLGSLRRQRPERATLLASLGALYVNGLSVDWDALYSSHGRPVRLPSYPWQHERFWIDTEPVARARTSIQVARRTADQWRDWLYDVQWVPKPLPDAATKFEITNGETWLIFADGKGVGEALARLVESMGGKCILVWRGNSFETLETGYHLNPSRRDEFEHLFVESLGNHLIHKVIYLWSLDAPPPRLLPPDLLVEAQTLSCEGVVHLVQALALKKEMESPRLWLVSDAVHAVQTAQQGDLSVIQGLLWGLGRVIALDHPNLWGGLVDLPPPTDPTADPTSAAVLLTTEILGTDGEDQVVYRDRKRYVARLVKNPELQAQNHSLPLRSDATYLITGGLGNLGFHVADWLAQHGVKHILLTSRNGLPDRKEWSHIPPQTDPGRKIAHVGALEAQGINVTVAKADVSNPLEMSALWDEAAHSNAPIRGIFHAAGVVSSGALTDLTPETLRATLQPKVLGTWTLHQVAREKEDPQRRLDFFVLFSSAAAIWGSKGLAAYAAANHFMDTFAHYRRSQGLCALSVNWGWWSGDGMVDSEFGRYFSAVGLAGLDPEQGIAALEGLLKADVVQKTVAAVEWSVFKQVYESKRIRPLLERLGGPTLKSKPKGELPTSFVLRFQESSPRERESLLFQHVRESVARILGFSSSERLDDQKGFFKMGMDSILTVQLRNRLETTLGCSLPPTVAFEYPNVQKLTTYLLEVLSAACSPSPGDDVMITQESKLTVERTKTELDLLSEDKLVAMLDEELDAVKDVIGSDGDNK